MGRFTLRVCSFAEAQGAPHIVPWKFQKRVAHGQLVHAARLHTEALQGGLVLRGGGSIERQPWPAIWVGCPLEIGAVAWSYVASHGLGLIFMADRAGLEPATRALTVRCS